MISLPITIPNGATVLVNVGDRVTHGQVLAKTPNDEEHVINIAKLLRIPVKKVPSLLQIHQGDEISVGDILALRKNIFGVTISRLKSNVNGTVLRFEEGNGLLVIGNPHQREIELVSPLAGVIQVCHNDQIVIQTNENIVQGIGGIGETARGKLLILPDVSDKSIDQQQLLLQLNGSIIDKIIFSRYLSKDALIKAIGIGVTGIIVTEIDPNDMNYLQQKSLIVPIVHVGQEVVKTLLKQADKEVFLEGLTFTILLLT